MNGSINSIITCLNNVGEGFWDYAVSLFVQSSALIVLLLLVDIALRKRVRAVFRYCIWMLVFVKLVLPTSFALPTGIGNWVGDFLPSEALVGKSAPSLELTEPVVMRPDQTEPTEAVVFEPPAYETFPVVGGETAPIEPVTSMVSRDAGPVESKLEAITWQGLVFLGWLVGMLVLSILLGQRAWFVKRLLAQASEADSELLSLLCRCRGDIGLKENVRLKISANMVSPAVCGLIRPVIFLPVHLVRKLNEEKLRAVLIHELAHIKRRDIWVNVVQTVLQIAYFYNPFVWLANAMVRRVREQAVDEMVLVALGKEADGYSDTLIDIGEMAFWRPNLSLRLIGVVESKKALIERIRHIASRPMPKSAKVGILGLAIVIIIGAVLLPMAKAERWTSTSSGFENPYGGIGGPAKSMIYWTDPDTRKIFRANLDGTAVVEVVSTQTALFDLALDLVHGKVYWTEPEAHLIKRANLDGSYIEVVAEGLENPACIALDLHGGKIYWTDLQGGRIQRANLEGSDLEDLVTTGLGKPEGICLDVARGRIYWTDIETKRIQRANLDGTYVQDVVTSEVKYPRGIVLDVAAEKMYWTDLFPPRIRRANMDGSGVEDVIKAEQMSADGRRDPLYVDYVDPDKRSRVYEYGPESVLRDPDILRLDLAGGKMYWTDLYKRKVLRANLDGTGIEEVITGFGPRGIDLVLSVPTSVSGTPTAVKGWSSRPSRTGRSDSLWKGLIAHWKFDEGSGRAVHDSAGGHHGIVQGATWTGGKIRTGLGFDGVDDVVNTALNVDQSPSSKGVTFCAWVYPTSISAGRHQVISSDNRGYDWSLLRQADTWYVFTGENSRSTGFSVDLFTWQHVAAIFVPGTGVRFYKNGRGFSIPHIDYDESDNNISIGDNPGHWDEFFAGVIDDVRIYNRALSAEQVKQIRGITARRRKAPPKGAPRYAVPTAGPRATERSQGLVGYWKFNEGSGTMTYDSAGKNHGIVREAVWTTGKIGTALGFDGKDDYLDCGNDSSLDLEAEGFSVEAWVKLNPSPLNKWLVAKGRWGNDRNGDYWLNLHPSNNNLNFAIMTSAGYHRSPQYSYSMDRWYHSIGVFDGSSLALYVNGQLVGTPTPVVGSVGTNDHIVQIGGEPSNHANVNGVIDEVRIYNRALSVEEIEQLYQTQRGTKAHPPALKRAQRSVGPSLTEGISGKGYYFDGVDDYIKLPQIFLDDFSVCYWVKTRQNPGSGAYWFEGNGMVDAEADGVCNDWGTALIDHGKVAFGVESADTTIKSRSVVNDGNWHYVTATRNKSSGRMMLYIDGESESEGTSNRNTLNQIDFIGVGNNSCDAKWDRRWFEGTIDEVALFGRVLSAHQVREFYKNPGRLTGNERQLIGYWNFDGDSGDIVIDSSPQGNHGRLAGKVGAYYGGAGWAQRPPARTQREGPESVEGIRGKAYYFDGEGDFVNVNESDSLDISGDQVTISAWVKAERFDKRQVIAAKTGWGDNSWLVEINPIDCDRGKLNFYLQAGGRDRNFCSQDAITTGTWHHVAFVYNGQAKIIYINGRFSGSQAWSGNINTNNQSVRIGAWGDPIGPGETRYFKGAIDEIAIYNRALSSEEIQRLYHSVSAFEGKGLVGHWNFDVDDGGAVIDSSGYGNHGRLEDRTEGYYRRHGWATPPGRRGPRPRLTEGVRGKAYYFDAKGGHISIDESESLDISGKEITISAWIKADRIDRRQVIVAKTAAGDNTWIMEINPIDFKDGTLNFYLELAPVDDNFGSKTAIVADRWYHIVMVCKETERMIYLDGQRDVEQAVSGDIPLNDQPVRIGNWGSLDRPFNGTIDEVAIFNRALSDHEIRQLYRDSGRLRGNEAGLVGYWNFDTDDGDTVIDSSRYGNHGKLEGCSQRPTWGRPPGMRGGDKPRLSEGVIGGVQTE